MKQKTYKQQLADQCQLIQDDLDCILDKYPEQFGYACEMIVKRFTTLKEQLDQTVVITSEKGPDNGGVPVTRFRVRLPENCEVNIDEENGEIIIDN